MSFSEYDVDRRTKKGNFLQQLNVLINWDSLSLEIQKYYSPKSDVIGRPAYAGILLFKMLLVGIWSKGLSDEAVEDMANSNLHVMRFLGIKLEDDVPDHSVLSRFRTALTKANAWNDLLDAVNQQLANLNAKVSDGYHVDASVTISQRQPKGKPTDEVRTDRSEQDDEHHAHQEMSVLAVTNDGLVEGVITTAANTHDSQPFMALVDQCKLPEGSRLCADKGYTSQAHRDYLKERKIKDGIQSKAVRGKPLTTRQKTRNKLITKQRFVVERTFGGQALWFGGKN